ncbi:uncharacterized protein LOC122647132 [Telopea speciosissima]|uniref:uncharacterized protein LOC122647132 n=1 Tax=Telopea speciosissima TaxID=54955 RepID=UPI001CC46018|nr:uncharacterized protein LOC122647132 [Telopea speciosissima]
MCIPTPTVLPSRGIPIETTCPRCGEEEETPCHLLIECPFARSVWELLSACATDGLGDLNLESVLALMGKGGGNLSERSKVKQCMVAYSLWEIWKARNAFIFSNEMISARKVCYRALSQAKKKIKTQQRSTQKANRGTTVSLALLPKTFLFRWLPTRPPWVKINFDGSLKPEVGYGSAGFVCRDDLGSVIWAQSWRLKGTTVPMAELRGAWEGLRCAHSSGQNLLLDIGQWRQQLEGFIASHTYREGNQPADWVTDASLETGSFQATESSMPDQLRSLVKADR